MRLFVHAVLGREIYENLPEERREQMRANILPQRAQFLGAGFEALSEFDVRRIQVPIL